MTENSILYKGYKIYFEQCLFWIYVEADGLTFVVEFDDLHELKEHIDEQTEINN